MPAKSRAQQRLMQAAQNGAQFPAAQKIRQTMTPAQVKDFTQRPIESEVHTYDWRTRQNLKQNRGR